MSNDTGPHKREAPPARAILGVVAKAVAWVALGILLVVAVAWNIGAGLAAWRALGL